MSSSSATSVLADVAAVSMASLKSLSCLESEIETKVRGVVSEC